MVDSKVCYFLIDDEEDFALWQRMAAETGAEMTMETAPAPRSYPCLILADTTFEGETPLAARIYFAYRDSFKDNSEGPAAEADGCAYILMSSDEDFDAWRARMAMEDVLISTNTGPRPEQYPCVLLSKERMTAGGNACAEVFFVYEDFFDQDMK